MAVSVEQVRAALDPEEPEYVKAAKKLGPAALPHLAKIVGGNDSSLAAKAAYLAGLIGGSSSAAVVAKAARSGQPSVRIAAAAAARHLSAADSDGVLLQLVDDSDAGVQKVALRSAPATMSDALRARVQSLARSAAAAPAKTKRTAKGSTRGAVTSRKSR